MKLSVLIAATIAAVLSVAAPDVANAQAQVATAGSPVATVTPSEALEAAKATILPAGVSFTGTVEDLQAPAATGSTKTESADNGENSLQESHGHGFGHHGFGGHGFHDFGKWGHGGFGGFGGFGHHRFGFSCGGIDGWAYPLDYWNSFGAGLYGLGGCGLGLSAGGLFYC